MTIHKRQNQISAEYSGDFLFGVFSYPQLNSQLAGNFLSFFDFLLTDIIHHRSTVFMPWFCKTEQTAAWNKAFHAERAIANL